MADNNSSVICVERNGVEFFILVKTGESGISQRGLTRLSEIPQKTLNRWLSDLSQNKPVVGLESLRDKDLNLSHFGFKRGGIVKAVKAEYAFEILYFAAFDRGSKVAAKTLKDCGKIGLESYIQGITNWLPSQYQASPAARQSLSRILDTADPWVKLYEQDFCRKVYSWFGPQFYWQFCYCFLTPIERCKIEQLNPVIDGDRKHRIHQFLEPEIKTRLTPYILQLLVVASLADSGEEFMDNYRRYFEGIDQLKMF